MALKRQQGGDPYGAGPGVLEEEPEGGRGLAPLGVVDVAGPSMLPTLRDGDRLLVRYGAPLRPGAVVVARHPLRQNLLLVKRAVERRRDGWWLLSDNSFVEGDSRDFGAVPDELVLGRVLLRLRPNPVWLAPACWLERLLRRRPLGRVPGLAARFGVFTRVSPEM
ncbi:nickel-type superoxide dismutase maturation protease [Peterkaempfera bronchialis]|uniref:Nickel-type superoxide dismutase maturation protease n=1 Tax=Peterkaempfera bronchialis TaxID=2126346 RepID=A0A345T099_9ACTN|nr:nickel-type superoxide dismutase maturation protease [Peterkaempfera bronchialis]AXI79404.1 nickel-type superoxide dismutase maturation protease [Peterkaempfera bronchialis]